MPRKPVGERAMTAAERQRRRRERLKEQSAQKPGTPAEPTSGDLADVAAMLREQLDRANADADKGDYARAFGRLEATLQSTVRHLEGTGAPADAATANRDR